MHCVVLNNGLIGERKGVNIPNVDISLPAVTERDRQDILFGLTQNIDYIAASFIRNGKAVEEIRELCLANGGEHVTIFPKIECALGVEKFDEILELPTASWSLVATWVSRSRPSSFPTSRRRSSPSATRLTSPLSPPRRCSTPCSTTRARRVPRSLTLPTPSSMHRRVMLSGETAAGQYPVEAVAMQARIAIETEKYMPAHAELAMPENASGTRVVNNVVGMSAVQMATAVGAKCITVPTTTGRTARLISHFRPNMPICAFSRHEWAVQQMIMYWGVIPRQAEITQAPSTAPS